MPGFTLDIANIVSSVSDTFFLLLNTPLAPPEPSTDPGRQPPIPLKDVASGAAVESSKGTSISTNSTLNSNPSPVSASDLP